MKLKTITKLGAALTAAFALTSVAQALPYINGQIDFTAQVEFQNSDNTPQPNKSLATQVKFLGIGDPGIFQNPFVSGVGVGDVYDIEGAGGALVTFNQNPWIFAPAPGGLGLLWTTAGFTFTVGNITVSTNPMTSSITVVGDGFVSHSGYNDTNGVFEFTSQGNGSAKVAWSSTTTSVPDGGTTVSLLGFSLLGLAGARRKFAKR